MKTRGNEDTVKRIKAIRLHVTRYLCGHPLFISAHPSLSINSKGLPNCLGNLQELIDGDVWDKRHLLTLLRVSRGIPCKGVISLSSITDKSKATISDKLIEDIKFITNTWIGKTSPPR